MSEVQPPITLSKKQLEWNPFPYREADPYIDRACRALETKLLGKKNLDGTETPKNFPDPLSFFDQEKVDPKKTKLKINKQGKEYAQSLYDSLLKQAGSEENVINAVNAFREEAFVIGEDGPAQRKFLDEKIKLAFPDDPSDQETVRLKRRALKRLLTSVSSRARRNIKAKEEERYRRQAVSNFQEETSTERKPDIGELSRRVRLLKEAEKISQEQQAQYIAESMRNAQQATITANRQLATGKGLERRNLLKILGIGAAAVTIAALAPQVAVHIAEALETKPTPKPIPPTPATTPTETPRDQPANDKQEEDEKRRLEEAKRIEAEQKAQEAARKLEEDLKKKRESYPKMSEKEKALAKKAEDVINAYFVNIEYKGKNYRIPVSFGENGFPRETLKGTTETSGKWFGKGRPEEVAKTAQEWVKTKEFQDYAALAEQKLQEKITQGSAKPIDMNVFLSRILADNGFFMDCSGTVIAVIESIYQELGLDFNKETTKQRGFQNDPNVASRRASYYIAPQHFEEFLKPNANTGEVIATIVPNKLSDIHTGDVLIVYNSSGNPVHSIVVISNDVREGKLLTAQSSDVTVGPEVHIGPHFTEFTYKDPDGPISSARTREVVWEGDYGWDADVNYAALQGQEATIRLKGVKIVRFRALEARYIASNIMAPRTETAEELQILIDEKVKGVENPAVPRIKPGMPWQRNFYDRVPSLNIA